MTKKERIRNLCEQLHSQDETESQEARDALFNEIAPFIGHIINKKYPSFLSHYEELFQEGALAVMENIDKYDPEKGAMTTFFAPRIRDRISLIINSNINKTNKYYSKKIRLVKEAQAYFEAKGITPTVNDIHIRTNLSMKSVAETIEHIRRVDMSYSSEVEPVALEEKPAKDTPEKILLEKERTNILSAALLCLPEYEQEAIKYRYGFYDGKTYKIADIAKLMNISENKVKSFINHGLQGMRRNRDLARLHEGKLDKAGRIRNQAKIGFKKKTPSTDFFLEEEDEHLEQLQ